MKKRLVAILSIVAILAIMLCGCGVKAVCDFCGEEKFCQEKSLWGSNVKICSSCQKEIS